MSSISTITSGADPYQATNLNAFVKFVNDFNAIGNALRSGDLSGAQNALNAFKDDLPNSKSPGGKPFGDNNDANNDYTSLASALQGGNLAGAQQAYVDLRTDLESGGRARRRPQRGSTSTQDPASDEEATTSNQTEDDGVLDVVA